MQDKILNHEELREQIFNEFLTNAQLNNHEHNPPSEHLEQYLKMMNYKDIQQCKTYKSQIIASLSNSHSFNIDTDSSLKISVIESSRDGQYALLEVHYNRFEFYVYLLNVDQESPSHKIEKSHSGNFSTVYHTRHNNKDIAIKCTTFQNKTFQKVFRSMLLEQLVFQMAARLKSGPAMPKIYSFDLIVFKNCIEFSMQFCSHKLKPSPAHTTDLVYALRNLHSINIIHFDIKPDNICFSQETGKAVFIDFGLHSMVREEVGYKSMTQFGGSLLNCSEEMKKVFMEGSGAADLYYNDTLCLMESLNQVKHKRSISIVKKVPTAFVQTHFHALCKIKYAILQIKHHEQHDFQYYQFSSLLKQIKIHQILNFIINLNYSISLQALIDKIQRQCSQIDVSFVTRTLFRRKLDMFPTKQFHLPNQFNKRLILIEKLNVLNNIEGQFPYILDQYANILANEEQAKGIQQRVYYHLFAQMQQVNCWKVNQRLKEVQTILFNKIWLHLYLFESLTFEEKQCKCFSQICDFILKQDKIDKALYPIIKYSLLSAMYLKIYTIPELQMFIKSIMRKQCPTVVKIRMFIHILSSIAWVSQCTQSIYKEHYFNDIVFSEMNQYLSNLNNQSSNIQEQITLVNIILSHCPMKTKRLINKLPYLEMQLNNKITKFYTSVRQEELIVSQIYVYILCNVISYQPQNTYDFPFAILNKLLTLQSYRKEAKLCLYDYYEHTIASIITRSAQYIAVSHKIQSTIFLANKFAYNYINSPEMNLGEFYYVRDNIVYFFEKDLSKLTDEQAFLYRAQIIDKCTRLILTATIKRQKIDIQSLIAVARLSEMYAFIPQLEQKAGLKSYHICTIPKYFKVICHQIQDYIQIQEYRSRLDHQKSILQYLFNLVVSFMDGLKCVSCKFQCMQTYLLTFGAAFKQISLLQLQQNVLQYLIWRMKQQDLSKKTVTSITINLCSIPGKQYVYETFLAQYIIDNNVPPSIFYQLGITLIQTNSNLLAFLWSRRHITTECGLSLYFRFILYLCRHLQFSKFLDPCYIPFVEKFINLFFRDIDYEDFFSFNSHFLSQNKELLKNEKYSAFYFSLILFNPFASLNQFVSPSYYAYFFRFCPFLSFPCNKIVQTHLFASFIKNQMQYSNLNQRRKFYLMKMEFKSHSNESSEHNQTIMLRKVLKEKLLTAKKMIRKDKKQSKLIYNKIKKKALRYCLQQEEK